ncbi:MAG: hypothetical protein ACE5FC_05460 [Myxococcota bacterium]
MAPKMDRGAAPAKTLTRKGAEPVLKLNKDTARNLKKLKDTQRIQVGTREMTVRELKKLRETEQKKQFAKVRAMPAGEATPISAMQAAFDKAETSRLEAANARAMAEMAKIGKQPAGVTPPTNGEAIRSEALAIQKRVRGGTATPADEKRAKELYDQYQQLK